MIGNLLLNSGKSLIAAKPSPKRDHLFGKAKKVRSVRTIRMAVVSRRDLSFSTLSQRKPFPTKTTHTHRHTHTHTGADGISHMPGPRGKLGPPGKKYVSPNVGCGVGRSHNSAFNGGALAQSRVVAFAVRSAHVADRCDRARTNKARACV